MTDQPARLPRLTCPVCGREVAARRDGTVRNHYPPPVPGERPRWCAGGYREDDRRLEMAVARLRVEAAIARMAPAGRVLGRVSVC